MKMSKNYREQDFFYVLKMKLGPPVAYTASEHTNISS